VVQGDFERVRTALDTPRFFNAEPAYETGGEPSAAVCLDSDGGSYLEAVAIAELFYERAVATVVDAGMRCYSACALIFMAGRTHGFEADYPNRRLHIGGMLGFHAPYLVMRGAQYDSSTVELAYRAANLAISRFLRLANKRGAFSIAEPHVRTSLVEEFLLRDKSDMLIIDSVDKAGRWGISLFGYRSPGLNKRTAYHACNNMLSWKADAFAVSSDNYRGAEEADYVDGITLKPYTGASENVLTGNLAVVDWSGLDIQRCSIVSYASEEENSFVSVCAIVGDLQFGYQCADERDAFGELMPSYILFDPAQRIVDLPPA
jgi:hypothetical protein